MDGRCQEARGRRATDGFGRVRLGIDTTAPAWRAWGSGFISSPLYMTDSEKVGAKDRIKTSKARMASGVWMSNPQKQAAIKVWIRVRGRSPWKADIGNGQVMAGLKLGERW